MLISNILIWAIVVVVVAAVVVRRGGAAEILYRICTGTIACADLTPPHPPTPTPVEDFTL